MNNKILNKQNPNMLYNNICENKAKRKQHENMVRFYVWRSTIDNTHIYLKHLPKKIFYCIINPPSVSYYKMSQNNSFYSNFLTFYWVFVNMSY
jgi:hypothetical protein